MVNNDLEAIGEANILMLKQLAAASQALFHPGAPILMTEAQRQACIIKAVLHK